MESHLEIDRRNNALFVGTEVEHTKFLGHKTLFVPGRHNPQEILGAAEASRVTHIYLGANQQPSFDFETAEKLLAQGYCVTIDVPYAGWYLCKDAAARLGGNTKFSLMISVPLPGITKGVFVKIDDFLESKSNEGVWVFSVDKSVQNFTPWSAYSNDREV